MQHSLGYHLWWQWQKTTITSVCLQDMAQTSTMADLAPGWEGARRLSSLQLEVTQVVRKLCEGVHAFIMLGSIADRQTFKANIHPCLLFLQFHANKPSKSTLFYTIIHTCMQVWYLYIPSISRLLNCHVHGGSVKVCYTAGSYPSAYTCRLVCVHGFAWMSKTWCACIINIGPHVPLCIQSKTGIC